MAFDCVIIDFQNKNGAKNINRLENIFPYARIIPFVSSYLDVLKSVIADSKTEYTWVLSSKIDYSNFDFDYLPEQHQAKQVHVWNNKTQKEGDTLLVPQCFLDQSIKFLRDYKDVNYHNYDLTYDFDYHELKYDLSNVMENLTDVDGSGARYIRYSDTDDKRDFYPSYWEDLKIYKDKTLSIFQKKH